MPFKSRAQFKKFKQLVAEGKISPEVMKEWTDATPNMKALPYRLTPKKKPKKDEGPAVEGPKKNPDIPPYQDDQAGGWTKGTQESMAFQKAAFVRGFNKTAKAMQSLAGSTDEGIKRHNQQLIEKMRAKKPMYTRADIATLYPGLKRIMKTAEPSMSQEANSQSGWSIGDEMPGTSLRNNAETGQFQGKNYRTQGVQNENREMKQSLKTKAQTSRGGSNYGSFREGFSKNSKD
jgi:hypothetical protein